MVLSKENFTDDVTNDFTDNFTDENPRLKQIVFCLYRNNRISMAQLATKLNATKRTIASDIAYLKIKGIIKRVGNK